MIHRARTAIAAALLVAAPSVSHAALAPYSQNFEGLLITNPSALSANGWLVYGNVFSPDHSTFEYGYGPFPAPNGLTYDCSIVAGQGGVDQGAQQLSVYSDYNNANHGLGKQIELNVYREQTIAAGNLGSIWTFQFDAKLGNLVAPTKAIAFIKTIDPNNGYAMTNFFPLDMTAIPATWNTYTISIRVNNPALVGQLLQIGFNSTASNYVSSGVFYDNISWSNTGTAGVGPNGPGAMDLRPAAPNPFRNSTRLDYSLPQQGFADVSVYDVTGRRVATLFRGVAEAGPHAAIWDGRFEDGRLAPAGVYHSVLQTAAGRVTRNIVLAR